MWMLHIFLLQVWKVIYMALIQMTPQLCTNTSHPMKLKKEADDRFQDIFAKIRHD